jgi:LysM repeat protein
MRIKSMPRFILSITILFILLLSFISLFTTKVFSYENPKYDNTVVASGDTLWSIAKNYEGNINEKIYEIKKINNLDTSDIYVGQELLIPID